MCVCECVCGGGAGGTGEDAHCNRVTLTEEHEEHTILSNLSCTNKECNAYVEVAWGGKPQIETGSHTPRKTKKKSKRKVKYEPGMVSCAGVEHVSENEEIDWS